MFNSMNQMPNMGQQMGGTMGQTPMQSGAPSSYSNNSQMPTNGFDPSQSQSFGQPQTNSYAHGGRARKRHSMVEVYVSKPEIEEMVEAQGMPEYDKLTGRHVFKKLGRLLENPHIERAIRARFAQGGGMSSVPAGVSEAQRYAHGGHVQNGRSPAGEEQYARGGDTDLVYITPHMKRLFDETGRGNVNPVNGRHEYFGLSDIWGGIKNLGQGAVSALNTYAPKLAEMARPFAAKLPGQYGMAANAALDMAPGLVGGLNHLVNPSQYANQPAPNYGDLAKQAGAHMANIAGAGMNNPLGRGMQAAGQSYLNNQNFRQGVGNTFNAATQDMPSSPLMESMRRGADTLQEGGSFGNAARSFGQGMAPHMAPMAQQMGQQAMEYMPQRMRGIMGPMMGGGTNSNRQQAESAALENIYGGGGQQQSYPQQSYPQPAAPGAYLSNLPPALRESHLQSLRGGMAPQYAQYA